MFFSKRNFSWLLQTMLLQGVSMVKVARLICGNDKMCPVCFKSFLYVESMLRHCRSHLVSKHSLQCPTCGKLFHRKDAFKNHKFRCPKIPPPQPSEHLQPQPEQTLPNPFALPPSVFDGYVQQQQSQYFHQP